MKRFTALLLALIFVFALAACGEKPDTGSQTPATQAPATQAPATQAPATQAPAATPAPSNIPDKETQAPASQAPATQAPASQAPETQAPATQTPATAEPTPTPTPEPPAPAADATALGVYAAMSAVMGGNDKVEMGILADVYYDLDTDDLEDFCLFMPDSSSTMEEIFIAKVKPGKLNDIKAACDARLKEFQDDAKTYPATGAYVSTAQVVTQGDWVLLCVTENNAAAADAFRAAAK